MSAEVTSFVWSWRLVADQCSVLAEDEAASWAVAGKDGIAWTLSVDPQHVIVVGCAVDDVRSAAVA